MLLKSLTLSNSLECAGPAALWPVCQLLLAECRLLIADCEPLGVSQQVNRNLDRFPADFMFRLTEKEFKDLILQNATSKKSCGGGRKLPYAFTEHGAIMEFDALRSQIVISKGRGGRRHLPYAFTEHGAIMEANVLNSERAVEASVQVVRASVRLRRADRCFLPAVCFTHHPAPITVFFPLTLSGNR
jgi:ORF6N domain-containing protein